MVWCGVVFGRGHGQLDPVGGLGRRFCRFGWDGGDGVRGVELVRSNDVAMPVLSVDGEREARGEGERKQGPRRERRRAYLATELLRESRRDWLVQVACSFSTKCSRASREKGMFACKRELRVLLTYPTVRILRYASNPSRVNADPPGLTGRLSKRHGWLPLRTDGVVGWMGWKRAGRGGGPREYLSRPADRRVYCLFVCVCQRTFYLQARKKYSRRSTSREEKRGGGICVRVCVCCVFVCLRIVCGRGGGVVGWGGGGD